MGFREALNRNPAITTGATTGLIVVALGFILWTTFGGGGSVYDPRGHAFYTADGVTFFVGSADKIYDPPKVGSQDAFWAHVFSCDGQARFIGYVERLSPEAAAQLAGQVRASGKATTGSSPQSIIANGREVRRPREPQWVKIGTEAATAVIEVKCADGKSFATEVSADE